MVLIFISLSISDVEHLLLYLLVIWMSSLEKYVFISSTHFLIVLVVVFVTELHELFINIYRVNFFIILNHLNKNLTGFSFNANTTALTKLEDGDIQAIG